jgi:Carboxypeptidase regulatory-like domain
MRVRFALVIGALLLLSGTSGGQEECHERFKSGEYKGFMACSASMLVILQDPFKVREAKGVVLLPTSKDPIPNVLVEFRDTEGRIIATKTDSRGRFQFRHLKEGTYIFKTTLLGFSSVIGTVVLDKTVTNRNVISLEMPVGV